MKKAIKDVCNLIFLDNCSDLDEILSSVEKNLEFIENNLNEKKNLENNNSSQLIFFHNPSEIIDDKTHTLESFCALVDPSKHININFIIEKDD